MKIVNLSHRFWPCIGGVETHVMQLCKELNAKGIWAKVVCLNKCPNSSKRLLGKERHDGIKIERVGFLDLGVYRIAPGAIGKVKGFDVVHVHGIGFFSDFFALFKLFHRKRLVLSTHGGIFHTKRHLLLKKIYFNIWCRLTLMAFDRVIAVSAQDFETFKKIVPKKKLVLIENPIEVKKQQGTKPKGNGFLFVGRLSKNKGLNDLIETFAIVKKEIPKVKLRIVGGDFDLSRQELEKKVLKLGLEKNIEILGHVSGKELERNYTASGISVSASKYEGFGISSVEAMSKGLIPILNDIRPFRAFVKDGENGFVVDFENWKKAAEKIVTVSRMSNAEKGRIRKNARVFAQGFSWKKNIAKFEKVYNAVLVQS